MTMPVISCKIVQAVIASRVDVLHLSFSVRTIDNMIMQHCYRVPQNCHVIRETEGRHGEQ